jgi:hypothetical protein
MSWSSTLVLALALAQEPVDRAGVRERLGEILRNATERGGVNPEFEEWKRDWRKPPPKPPEPARAEPPTELPSIVGQCFAVALILVAAVVLAAVVYALFVASRERAASDPALLPKTKTEEAAVPMDALRKPPEGWLEDARKYVGRGDFRQAIRCLMLAILNSLHRARQIDYEKSKTNRECLAGFRGEPARRGDFSSLILLFELAWYGAAPMGPADYQRAEQMARALREGAPLA